jgi:hypothetical protein
MSPLGIWTRRYLEGAISFSKFAVPCSLLTDANRARDRRPSRSADNVPYAYTDQESRESVDVLD